MERTRQFFVLTSDHLFNEYLGKLYEHHVKNPHHRLSEKEEKNMMPMHGGTLFMVRADTKNLGLVDNGHGRSINEQGIRFYQNKDQEFRRNYFLKVKYFQSMFNLGIKTEEEAQKFLLEQLKGKYSSSVLKTIVRTSTLRYLYYIYGISAFKKRGRQRRSSPQTIQTLQDIANGREVKNPHNFDEYLETQETIKVLIQKHGVKIIERMIRLYK